MPPQFDDDVAVDLGIGLGRCAVALAERDTAERAEYSCNLGAGLFAQYRHHANEAGLDEAIILFGAADGFGGDNEQAVQRGADATVHAHRRCRQHLQRG